MEIIAQTLHLDKVCRVCLFESEQMFSIFSILCDNGSKDDSPCIFEMLISISNFKVELNDGLPSQICSECIYNTLSAYKFQKQCNKTQEIWDNYIIQLENIKVTENVNVSISEQFITSNDLVDSINISSELAKETDITNDPNNYKVNEADDLDNDVFSDIRIEDGIKIDESGEVDFSLDDHLMSNLDIPDESEPPDVPIEKPSTEVVNDSNKDQSEVTNDKKYTKKMENGQWVYSCNSCEKVYHHSSSMRNHMKTHSKERPHVCALCGKAFIHYQSLNYHYRSHTGEQPYSCKICGKAYRQSGTLTAHMRIHTGSRPFLCSICGKGFRQAPDLTYHMRVHTKVKPYMCNVCGKTMAMQSHLVHHMRTHTGEKPYKCELCEKTFRSSSMLKRHVVIHTGLKPFQCEICKKCFNRKSTLLVHAKIHTDERPHICPICNKGFIQQHALRSHISLHSSVTSEQKETSVE